MAKWHIWSNHGDSSGPHNHRYNDRFEQALVPQNKAMNDRHLAALCKEWLLKHPIKNVAKMDPRAKVAQQALQKKLAMDWAKRMEPKRYLNPLLRPINGIKADKGLRRNQGGSTAILSSSWVGDVKFPEAYTVNPQQVTFDLGGKDYTFKLSEIGGYEGLKRCLSAPSIGSYISRHWIGKLPSSKNNWKTGKSGELKRPNWMKKISRGEI